MSSTTEGEKAKTSMNVETQILKASHGSHCILRSLCSLCDLPERAFFLNIFLNFIYLLIYLFLAVLGLHCCPWAFSSCGERGYSSLQCVASLCGGFSCCGAWALGAQTSVVVACRLSSCGSQALGCRLSSCGARA